MPEESQSGVRAGQQVMTLPSPPESSWRASWGKRGRKIENASREWRGPDDLEVDLIKLRSLVVTNI